MMKKLILGMLFGYTAIAGAQIQLPKVELDAAMKTRDGITLYADIYRPDGAGTFPVLLERTPYNKDQETEVAHLATARGFMVVIQDARPIQITRRMVPLQPRVE
jgi:predicted acyl esterase